MDLHPVWEVTLRVYGPIAVERTIRLNEPKGFRLEDPFYSDIIIKPRSQNGIEAVVTAFASNENLAYKAALLFFGQMLDVLAFRINQPLFLSFSDSYQPRNATGSYTTRRRVIRQDISDAFRESRLLALVEPVFLRSLGWYRKGLYTEDPFDKFVAFWNSIENVTSHYHPPIPDDRPPGSKSQMWESFKKIWGECDKWPIIGGQNDWIDTNNAIRNEIAHGAKSVNIEAVENVLDKMEPIKKVAYRFLVDWREKELNPTVPPELQGIYGYRE
ncbi:MAG: hypothetical protein D6732_10370 [Methanobacteriota archaeon]|nr:MAG: hypothetical protein D6732_10370 [Euryarchaeota archaeon]